MVRHRRSVSIPFWMIGWVALPGAAGRERAELRTGTEPGVLRCWAQTVEGLGFDLLMISDHVAVTPTSPSSIRRRSTNPSPRSPGWPASPAGSGSGRPS
jgi:chloramphenicol 3-O-phosphotransferase